MARSPLFHDALARARATERSRWWTTFVLAGALSTLWAFSTPVFGAPDEPAHSIRAASAARLQILGEVRKDSRDQLVVDAPRGYSALGGQVACYAFKRSMPADCAAYPDGRDASELGPQATSAGRHPPAYYVVAGIPTLAFRGEIGIHLMRLVSVLLTAAFLASAVSTLERLRRQRVGALGLLLAATPMLFFVGGTVNPSAAEIPAALCCWIAAVVLAVEAPTRVDPKLVRRVALSAIVLVLSRQLAPLWLALIAAAVLAVAGWQCLHALRKSRSALRWGAVVLAATVAQLGWILIVRPLDSSRALTEGIPDLSLESAFRISFGGTIGRVREMIGWFGWLDSPSPELTFACWAIGLGLLLSIALVAGRPRVLLVATLTAVATVAFPVFFEVLEARETGFFWQGRYSLPLAVGVPLLLALSVALDDGEAADERTLTRFRPERVRWAIAALVVVGHVAAFAQALRRNTVGYDGPLDFLVDPRWSPPLPPLLLVLGYLLVAACFVGWVTTTRASEPRAEPAQPDSVRSGSLRYS